MKERAEGILEAERARTELYDTLARLRDRLDYAQRFDDAAARMRARIQLVRDERPLAFAAGVGATAAVAGAAVWGIVRVIATRASR